MENIPVSLVGIKHSFGERVVENSEIEEKYGLPAGWVLEKTGKEKGHAWDNGPDAPVEASLKCFNLLLDETGIKKEQIKAIFSTTNPIVIDGNPREESLTTTFFKRSGLPVNTEVFEKSWGCGGSAEGVDFMFNWLKNQHIGTYIIYVTQDWSTKMVKDRNVEALFSDAVSVSLWTNAENGIMEITDTFSAKSNIDDALNIIGGYWEMDGKEVSKFASEVPGIVADKLGISLSDYDIVPHQPNPKLLETIESIYKIHLHKKVAIEHGNPTCSGVFIALEKAIEDRKSENSPNFNKDILVIPFGAGGFGGFILKNKK